MGGKLRKNKELSKELQRIKEGASVPREHTRQWESPAWCGEEDGAS